MEPGKSVQNLSDDEPESDIFYNDSDSSKSEEKDIGDIASTSFQEGE